MGEFLRALLAFFLIALGAVGLGLWVASMVQIWFIAADTVDIRNNMEVMRQLLEAQDFE
jgi:hypothetical protein